MKDFLWGFPSHNVSYATWARNSCLQFYRPTCVCAEQCSGFRNTAGSNFPISINFSLRAPPFDTIIARFGQSPREVFKILLHQGDLSPMTVEGLCMKCKTYGPIRDGQKIVMSNGRTRMAGFCSQAGCTGKISKIIS